MQNPFARKMFLYGLPAVSMVFIGFAPAAVQLNFVVTASIALISNRAIRNPTVRRLCGFSAMHKPTPVTPAVPLSSINVKGSVRHHSNGAARAKAEAAAKGTQKPPNRSPFSRIQDSARDFAVEGGSMIEKATDWINPGRKSGEAARREARETAFQKQQEALLKKNTQSHRRSR